MVNEAQSRMGNSTPESSWKGSRAFNYAREFYTKVIVINDLASIEDHCLTGR
jgi:hypothetical protein